MKKLIYIVMVLSMAACSSGSVDNPQTDEEILAKISEYKKEMADLNSKINELEEKLTVKASDNGIPVKVQQLKYEIFKHFIEVNGTVEAVNEAYISPEINGQVQEIYVKEGQYVEKGTLLLKINSSITRSSINEVETSLDLARTVFNKQKELWDKNIGSEMDYLQAKNNVEALESRLETLQSQLDMAEIKAPISGIVDEVHVKEGELAIPGMQVIELVNLTNLYVNADVSEAYITSIHAGEEVVLDFPSYPDISMDVPVYRTGNIINEANRTFKVQLKVTNRDNMIKPNVIARIRINDYTLDEALLVPSIIIKKDMQGAYLYVVNNEDESARKVYVESGRSYKDQTVITSGLNAGDRVIVEGYNQVSNGSKIRVQG
ncbi:MAG TPA: efflux RND transporter periplasmic adaptor subunit [Bacteroidales bacterium]|nr:efflux RND transporter periplasmic adaptor subunit [Bacteroidales bacterium]HRX98354.1 efflux RND transporter periplasmic adaptor subunit [Bacteroidales bacterium]